MHFPHILKFIRNCLFNILIDTIKNFKKFSSVSFSIDTDENFNLQLNFDF